MDKQNYFSCFCNGLLDAITLILGTFNELLGAVKCSEGFLQRILLLGIEAMTLQSEEKTAVRDSCKLYCFWE